MPEYIILCLDMEQSVHTVWSVMKQYQFSLKLFTFIFNCIYARQYREPIETDLVPELNGATEQQKKHFWFCGALRVGDTLQNNLFVQTAVFLYKLFNLGTKTQKD